MEMNCHGFPVTVHSDSVIDIHYKQN